MKDWTQLNIPAMDNAGDDLLVSDGCDINANEIVSVPVNDPPVLVPQPEHVINDEDLLHPQAYSVLLVPDTVHFVQAPYHQGGPDFADYAGVGKPCCAMAIHAIAMAVTRDPATWSSATMEMILQQGNVLYDRSIKANMGNVYTYLAPDNVVNEFFVYDQEVTLSLVKSFLGSHLGTQLIPTRLMETLEDFFSTPGISGVTISSFSYTQSAWKMNGLYWLFDSHSRDKKCKVVEGGKAFCGCYRTLKDLCWAYYQNYREPNGEVREGLFEVDAIIITCNPTKSITGPIPEDPVLPLVPQQTAEPRLVDTAPCPEQNSVPRNGGPKRKRAKETTPRRWYKRRRVTLQSLSRREILLHAGMENDDNADEYHLKLANEIRSLRATVRVQQNTIDGLRKKCNKLGRLSVKEFLDKKKTRTTRKIVQDIHIECGFDENSPFARTVQSCTESMEGYQEVVGVIWDETDLIPFLTLQDGSIIGYEDYGTALARKLAMDEAGNVMFAQELIRDRTGKFADKLLVFQVQGLLSKWHFPVAFAFSSAQANQARLQRLFKQVYDFLTEIGLTLRKARFYKVDPRTGQRKYVTNSPTLKNWASTAESIMALADIGKQYGKKLNPRVGVQTDSLESDFGGYKAHGNQGNKLTPAMAMASLKAVFIRGLVVPDNPHSNVQSTGTAVQDSLRVFLSRQQCFDRPGPAAVDSDDDIDDPDIPDDEGDDANSEQTVTMRDMIAKALAGAGIEFDDGADSANTNPLATCEAMFFKVLRVKHAMLTGLHQVLAKSIKTCTVGILPPMRRLVLM
ncbi:hypothetical protein ONE63_005140 [Megalurothrips usitatus]|uniref:Transposable element P transposase-like RNase H domain-containing protein n=1 Tax=Megalurothrips usitatus TaxID=439358 RepID=A0AAV7XUI1_9NEOP|nr:hypothetical protein ONE63_005140 [Megalurothrips usitatus]